MTLSQKGANYPYRENIQDQYVRAAHDDHASKIQAILTQGNFGANGAPLPPSSPAQLSVKAASGIITATIVHNDPPPGTVYRLQYSTTANFQAPISVDLGEVPVWQQSLPSQHLYFRVAAKFPASVLTPWVYFGGATSPTLVSS